MRFRQLTGILLSASKTANQMNETSLEQCYQPPSQPIGRARTVAVNIDRSKALIAFNSSAETSFLYRVLSSRTEIKFSGMFSLDMHVGLGQLKIGKLKVRQFSMGTFERFEFYVVNQANLDESVKMLVEYHLPFLHPMTETGLRIYADEKIIFEQAEIPPRFNLFRPRDAATADL
jgi:hypothetical protein